MGRRYSTEKNTASEKPRKAFFKTICIARRRNERLCLMHGHKNQTKSPAPFPGHAEISGTPASDAHRASPPHPETPYLPRSDRFLQPFLQGSPEKAPTGNASRQLPSARSSGFSCAGESPFHRSLKKIFFSLCRATHIFSNFFLSAVTKRKHGTLFCCLAFLLNTRRPEPPAQQVRGPSWRQAEPASPAPAYQDWRRSPSETAQGR